MKSADDGPALKAPQKTANWTIAFIVLAMAGLHIFTNGHYGLHRDELQVLDDAGHLAWGFVVYPPLVPFLERISLILFGHWLIGLRMFSLLAQMGVLVLSALIARELGGNWRAQAVAALAVAVSPLPMFEASEFQYTSFDLLWFVLMAYFLVRLLQSDDGRWWLAIGAAGGLGLETKYSMVFYLFLLGAALAFTPARKYFRSRWLWYGAAIAFAICLPNLIWQARHHFISYQFLHSINARDVHEGRAKHFWLDQLLINANLLLTPLWLAGLIWLAAARKSAIFRPLAWWGAMVVIFYAGARGRGYYAGAVYPMFFAAGSVVWEHWIAALRSWLAKSLQALTLALIALGGLAFGAILLPVPFTISAKNLNLRLNSDLREEIGWQEMTASVARIWQHLPPAARAHTAILTGNYGETGAIDFYGPALGLPAAISGVNTAWYRGYGDPAPQSLIVLGLGPQTVRRRFHACRLAGHNGNRYGIKNEESVDHPDIFLCGPPRQSWPVFWQHFRMFG